MRVSSADLKGVTWKILHLSDDKINVGRKKKQAGLRCLPPSSISAAQPLKLHWCCFYDHHKKETLGERERDDEMKGWRDEGEEGSGAGSGGRPVWESVPLEVSFLPLSQLESCVPLVPCSLVHNSSAVSHRSRSQSETAGANPAPTLSFLCLFSPIPPESSTLGFVWMLLSRSRSDFYFSPNKIQIWNHATRIT